jgi:hypothetical protein
VCVLGVILVCVFGYEYVFRIDLVPTAIAESKILTATVVRAYKFELAEGVEHDFYHLGGNTVKPKVRGRESEGVQLLLKVTHLI